MTDYPELITVDGVDYEINTDYRYGLACFQYINDVEISDTERAYGVIGTLYKEEPPNLQEALRMAVKYLQCGKDTSSEEQQPDMNFEVDENYIKTSFMSDYRIDLDGTDMHWWKFCNLLQGLTDDCILNRVRDIRNYDLSTVKDAKQRGKIIKAKQDFGLPNKLAPEEEDALDAFYSQLS
jgi:hypothetical protein